MLASVIIPVWNGENVVGECLAAIYTHSGNQLLEVIAVDNASGDASAQVIGERFPQVHLVSQAVNLGFAGGVNVGLALAQGDVMVLLNQDCLVHAGWLDGLSDLFSSEPACGIAGALVLDHDGNINHAGARITHPLAYGEHLTSVVTSEPYAVEYVTGALLAIRRRTWATIGALDEEYYPAYFEESDYCRRAQRNGFVVMVAPDVQVTHLFSSLDWQRDPIRHTANQHQSRYRYVCKNFSPAEVADFLAAEEEAAGTETSFHEATGRTLAAGATLDRLDAIVQARVRDGAEPLAVQGVRQLRVGLASIRRTALASARQLALPAAGPDQAMPVTFETWQAELAGLHAGITELRDLRAAQLDLLDKLFCAPADDGSQAAAAPQQNLWRGLVRRPINLITGRENRLLARLMALQVHRLDHLEDMLGHRLNLLETQLTLQEYQRRLSDLLTDYEHR